MKTGADWRKASWHHSRGSFNSSLKCQTNDGWILKFEQWIKKRIARCHLLICRVENGSSMHKIFFNLNYLGWAKRFDGLLFDLLRYVITSPSTAMIEVPLSDRYSGLYLLWKYCTIKRVCCKPDACTISILSASVVALESSWDVCWFRESKVLFSFQSIVHNQSSNGESGHRTLCALSYDY